MNFTKADGSVVSIPEDQINAVEQNPNYTVYSAIHNPTGETVMTVQYNQQESTMGGDDMNHLDNDFDVEEDDMNQTYEDPDYDVMENPSKVFDWRNLRLQSAILGEDIVSKGVSGLAAGLFRIADFRGSMKVGRGKSIRDSPILFLTTAKDWHQYVDNINTVDIGAEFAAGVSSAQRASCALFQAEWEADPAHSQLQSRLLPAADVSDAVAKGQLAYDLMVRGREILGKKGYGQDNQSVMFRLVYDIVRSMPMKSYNYYTLYQLHPDEGDEIYSEFQSRYVPLDTHEVEMVREIMHGLQTQGDSYAFKHVRDETSALNAAKLMKAAAASYEVGDTQTTRVALLSLTESPFNYKPSSSKVSLTRSGDSGMPTDSKVHFIKIPLKADNPMYNRLLESNHAQELGKNNLGVYAVGLSDWMFQDKNKQMLDSKKIKDPVKLTTGPYDTQPTYLALAPKKDKGNFTIVPFDAELLKAAGGSGKGKNKSKPKSVGQAFSNPKKPKNAANKRGKYFYIELHHKNKLDMKRKGPGEKGYKSPGETRHGKGSGKKPVSHWMKGLNKALGDAGKAQLLQIGNLKSTGEEVVYRMRVPTSHFGVAIHPEAGYRTLGPKKDKTNKEFLSAWKKILIEYGIPKHSPSKDTHFRFIIPKSERAESPYYQGLRARAGKKNNSR
jgi:hypothetical protein